MVGFRTGRGTPPPPPPRCARPGKGRLPASGPPYARRRPPASHCAGARARRCWARPKNKGLNFHWRGPIQNPRPLSLKRTGWRRGRAEPAGPDGRRGASQHAKKGRVRGRGREGGREGDLTGGEARCRDVRVPDAPGQPGRKLRLQVPRSLLAPSKPRAADRPATAGPQPGSMCPGLLPRGQCRA